MIHLSSSIYHYFHVVHSYNDSNITILDRIIFQNISNKRSFFYETKIIAVLGSRLEFSAVLYA